MSLKHEFRKLLWKAGYDLSRFEPGSHALARRKQLFERYGIDTVLDIGANAGEFVKHLRGDLGYTKKILSFEPLRTVFATLQKNAVGDPAWQVFNLALGDVDEKREINVAGNTESSSLLNMLPAHLQSAPESRYVAKETVEVKKVDSIFADLCKDPGNVYMKIDTQGFEGKVLAGAERSLSRIGTVQLEMSLVPLYEGEMVLGEMCQLMNGKGYSLVSIDPGFSDEQTGQLLQVDGIFHRL